MNNIPWIEKYRPKTLDEIVGNKAIIDVFRIFAREGTMPHLIITGSPGIGKTTVANALLNYIFRERVNERKEAVMELNASDERGIEVVRIKIKGFLQMKSEGERFLILDESDSMTFQAQQSMRRLLERHPNSRFIFICNDITKMSDTIQSRCAILRLSKLTAEDLATIIRRTAEAEGLTINEKSVGIIVDASEGDARQALNTLQTVGAISKEISEEIVERMSHMPPIETIREIFSDSLSQKDAIKRLDSLFEDGYSMEDISKMIFRLGKESSNIEILDKAASIAMKLSDSPSKIHFYAELMSYKNRSQYK